MAIQCLSNGIQVVIKEVRVYVEGHRCGRVAEHSLDRLHVRARGDSEGSMSARELAEAIRGIPTQSTIQNIELGRKAAIDVVQILNIAMALKVPLSYLLAPMGAPNRGLDLVGLSDDFSSMSVLEFDAWLSGVPDGARIATSLEERNAVSELQALRAWTSKASEVARLEAALDTERSSETGKNFNPHRSTEDRLADARRESERLLSFLRAAGWPL